MLHGAGVKLKTIDAIQNGLPVVSTTIGCEGTGLVHNRDIFITNNPMLFASYIREILLNPAKGNNIVVSAQKYLADNYDQVAILIKYLSNIFLNP